MKLELKTFYSYCEEYLYEEKFHDLTELYETGLFYLNLNLNLLEKERILYYLILLFPINNPQLYYFMGWIQSNHNSTIYWYTTAIQQFVIYRNQTSEVHTYEIENWLDLFKTLFEKNYTNKFQEFLDKYNNEISYYIENREIRILHILGAYYIKINKLNKAQEIYSILLDSNLAKDIELEYQIQNNALILYSRMAKFDHLHDLLKRNLTICQQMGDVKGVDNKTKQNLFCSNMLQFDYIYHDPIERRQLCESLVHLYYPTTPYNGNLTLLKSSRMSIGYVSADFLYHAVSNFILPILENHNTTCFRIVLFMCRYYQKIMTESQYEKIRNHCELVNIEDMSTEHVVHEIKSRNITVLFDLHGYTEKNRLDVFAQNPAPIQISYLGFPNTVGSNKILQWRITDVIADPVNSQQWWAEKLVRLRGGFLLYKSIALNAPLHKVKMDDYVIFAALNRESKNSPELMYCWREILRLTKNTKLLIKLSTTEDDEIHMEKYYDVFSSPEVPNIKERIIFSKYGTTEEYFALYSSIDVLLDCFPYSGTTTTCNALYNSIPVITMCHPHLHVHNVSASILHHIGLNELIAFTPDEYVNLAIQLSQDPLRLHRYRNNMQIHHKFCTWMTPSRFMKEYEGAILDIINQVEI
jgi:predicted O-linked N-acetylglucosamine transferase (SPINDLY family)